MLRLLKLFFLAGCIPVILFVGFNVCLVKFGDWQLSSAIDQSKASLKLVEQLVPAEVPDEENVAARLEGLASPLNSVAKLLPKDAFEPGLPRPMTASETAKLQLVLELHRPTLLAVQQAAKSEHYVPRILKPDAKLGTTKLDWEAMSVRLHGLRAAQSLLATHVRLLDLDRSADNAAQFCLTMLRLARHADNEPMRTGFTNALAMRRLAVHTTNLVVQSNRLSRKYRDEIEAELATHDLTQVYARAVQWERAYFVTEHLSRDCNPDIGNWLFAGVTRPLLAFRLHTWQRESAFATMTYAKKLEFSGERLPQPTSDDDTSSDNQASNRSHALEDAMLKLNHDPFLELCIATAELRCLRVINSLRLRGVEQLPAKTPLAELGLPEDMIVDPFNGATLQVAAAPLGMVIYSVGANLQDDAGVNIMKEKDVGLGPAFIIRKISARDQFPTEALAAKTLSP